MRPILALLLVGIIICLPLQQSRAKENLLINPYCAVLVVVVGGVITVCLWHLAKQTLYPPSPAPGTTNLVVSGSCKGPGWPNVDGIYCWQKNPNYNQGLIYVNKESGRCIWSGIAILASNGDPQSSAYLWFLTDSPGGGPYNYCCSWVGSWCGWTNVLRVDPTGAAGTYWNYPWLPTPVDAKNFTPFNHAYLATNYPYPNGFVTCSPDVEWQQPKEPDFAVETSATDTNVYISLFIGPDTNAPGNVTPRIQGTADGFALSTMPEATGRFGLSPDQLAAIVQDSYGITPGWTDPDVCAAVCTNNQPVLFEALVNGQQMLPGSTNNYIKYFSLPNFIRVPNIPGTDSSVRTLSRYTTLDGTKQTVMRLQLPPNITQINFQEDGASDQSSYSLLEK